MASEYYSLKSKRDGDVVDVRSGDTAAGTPLIAFPPNTPRTDNQLWGFILTGNVPYLFITVKQTGQVIDLKDANQAPGAPLIAYPQKVSGTDNQLWLFAPSDETGYFFITNKLTRGVITLEGPKQKDNGTPLVARPRKPSDNDDQLWSLVPA